MRSEKSIEKRWRQAKTVRYAVQLPRLIGYLVKLVIGIIFLNLRDASEMIVRTARQLIDSSRKVESRFLEMGNVLQVLYADLNALICCVKEITSSLAVSEDENLLQKANEISKEAMRVLDRYCRQASANLDSVDTLIKYLRNLYSACDRLDRIATNLRVIGINIGVECTRSEAALDKFQIVAKEIISFSDSIVAAGQQIREDANTAGIHEENTRKKIASGLNELQQLSRDASDIINASVIETESCITVARDVFDDSGMRFEEISHQVEEIVKTVQFHDSMRQRLEHITAALEDAGGLVVGRTKIRDGCASGMSRMASAYGVMVVQTGQIRDVIREIEHVYGQSSTAFEKIKEEVTLLVRGMASVCSMKSHAGGTDPFARLVISLRDLVSLIDRADELVAVIDESIERAAGTAKRFSRHLQNVETIGVDTHIKAINAIIKSDHLGIEGRTLEVLAQEMSTISGETDSFVLSMKKQLSQVGDFAETFRLTSKDDADDDEFSEQFSKENGRVFSKNIEMLSTAHARLQDKVKGAAENAEGLISGIQRSQNGLGFLPELADETTRHLEQLEGASEAFRHFGGGTRDIANSDVLRLADSYSMRRERDIHETIVSGALDEAVQMPMFLASGSIGSSDHGSQARHRMECLPGEGEREVLVCEEGEVFGDNVELF